MITTDGARQLAHVHPWLYHVVWKSDEQTRETVASDGLVSGHPRRRWHPVFLPRQGHVYLATKAYLDKWWMRVMEGDLYAVSTRRLLASRLNPDEDHFSADGIEACDRFALPRPLGMEQWELFGSTYVPSYGDWADQVGLGNDPRHTAWSASRGSLAYAGVIPPTALLRWDTEWRTWL